MTPPYKAAYEDRPAELEGETDVPKWIASSTRAWSERWGLANWTIGLKVARVVNEDVDTRGHNSILHNYLDSRITLVDSLKESTPADVRTVIHEITHIPLSEMDYFVTHELIPQLPEGARGLASGTFEHMLEQFNVTLTTLLYRLSLPTDYPERIQPLPPDVAPDVPLEAAAALVVEWCEQAMPQLIRDRPEFAALARNVAAQKRGKRK